MWFRRIAVVAASTVLAVAAGTAGAQAAINRQWRIVYHVNLKLPNYWWPGALAAPSRDQAWALGYTLKGGRISGDILEHWNGRRWRMTAVPGINLMPVAVAASSPDNVWLFSSANRAFRWDGQRWTRAPGTKGMPMGGGVVLGPSNVWTAGGTFCDASTLYHWTGSRWFTHALPGAVVGISGSSAKNFWVLTQQETVTSTCRPEPGVPLRAYRWDGSSFKRMRIPRIVNQHGLGGRLVVSSPSNIWIANIIDSPIMHWNGHRWSRLNKPPFDIAPAGIVPDGHGGAWIGGCWHWSAGTWYEIYAADACDETFGLVRIPRTMSAWRLGIATIGGRVESTIEVNGRLP